MPGTSWELHRVRHGAGSEKFDIHETSWPSLIAFFAAVEKKIFFYGCEKSCEGRPGYEAK